ncbi:MAG: helix-turn-helix domain-containing protein [Actinomycetaceae bacterium]|nr:helix-turn-helix domain-containing protein [Actinomycetaceae bacterium]
MEVIKIHPSLIDEEGLSDYFGVAKSTIQRWCRTGAFSVIPVDQRSKKRVFRRNDVALFLGLPDLDTPLISEVQLANWLGMTVKTFARKRRFGQFEIEPLSVGRSRLYKPADIERVFGIKGNQER